jgi:hypothetical protein
VNPDEALLTAAEISIAIIGFAGIVSALRISASSETHTMLRLRLRLMIEGSANVMFFSFLPFVLSAFLTGEQIWAFGSGFLAVTSPINLGSVYFRQKRLFGTALLRRTLLFDTSVIFMTITVEIVLILNCFGLFFEPSFGPYLMGVLLPMGVAVAMFVRSIFSGENDNAETPA